MLVCTPEGMWGLSMQVSQIALPVFLQRARSVLREYRSAKSAERLLSDNCLCCLDTLAAMTLSPAVTDVVLPPASRLKVLSNLQMPLQAVDAIMMNLQGITVFGLSSWIFTGSSTGRRNHDASSKPPTFTSCMDDIVCNHHQLRVPCHCVCGSLFCCG